jgi:hypothetical protein
MLNRAQKILLNGLGLLIFIIVIIFSYYGYRSYRNGPQIKNINMTKFFSTDKEESVIKGELENTKLAKINGREILLENGKNFEEIIVFSPGDNIIELSLEDAFRKTKKYFYHIFYTGNRGDIPMTLKEAFEIEKSKEAEKAKDIKEDKQ